MRDPEGRHPLAPVLEPRSIVVVGASADPAKRGNQILRALGASGYRGRVFAVNPKGGSILGHLAYPSIGALPEPADLAVLCTPAAAAPGLVEECGARGIPAAIVLAVGFGESGAAGAELEARLLEAARMNGVRLVGPNTSGVLNVHSGANLIGAQGVRPGGLALLVQSGNMALALMKEATERGWGGISVCLGIGNALDVGLAEALDYLDGHVETRGVIVYVEGFPDARHFLAVAAEVGRRKPIVLVKAARSAPGAEAARSHTGAVAGPYERLRAGLRQAGVVELQRTDELLHVAETLARQPVPNLGTGIAVLSDGGGQGTLAVDVLTELRAPLAVPSSETRAALSDLLGPAAATANPVDVAGAADADPSTFARALDVLAADAAVGSVLLVGLFGGYGIRFSDRLEAAETTAARAMAERMSQERKGFVVHSMYAHHRSPPLEALGVRGVPVVGSLEVACRCSAELHRRAETLVRPAWRPDAGVETSDTPEVLARARAEGRGALTEPEARALLRTVGVRFGRSVLVHGGDDAAEAVRALGMPVALKLVSAHILHKTDAGGVVLDVRSPDGARAAFTELGRAASRYAREHGLPEEPPAALVTPMLPRPRAELLVGVYRDPDLGPTLTLGAGGVWVEALADVTHRVLPVETEEVEAMLGELRIGAVLGGARRAPPIPVAPIVELALGVVRCVTRYPEVREVELNPVFVDPDRVEPVDVRVVLAPTTDDEAGRRGGGTAS